MTVVNGHVHQQSRTHSEESINTKYTLQIMLRIHSFYSSAWYAKCHEYSTLHLMFYFHLNENKIKRSWIQFIRRHWYKMIMKSLAPAPFTNLLCIIVLITTSKLPFQKLTANPHTIPRTTKVAGVKSMISTRNTKVKDNREKNPHKWKWKHMSPGYQISKVTVLDHFITSTLSSQHVSCGVRQEMFDYRFHWVCKWNAITIKWTGLTAALVESLIEIPINQEFLEPHCMTLIQIDFQH